MGNARSFLIDCVEREYIKPEDINLALKVTHALPDSKAWQHFITQLFLWLGATLLAAGIIFFFAYNWEDLGRFTKFGLVEVLIIVATGIAGLAGSDKLIGKVALLFASIATGALMALFGQTYQTGADPWQLFANWAMVILPWVFVGTLSVLWLMWIILINLATILYFQASQGFLWFIANEITVVWILFFINTFFLITWEFFTARGLPWLQQRWSARIVATLSGVSVSVLIIWSIFDNKNANILAFPLYLIWLGIAYWFYRFLQLDLYVLAASILLVIIVIAAFLGKYILRGNEAFVFLLLGLIVISLSSLGAWHLKNIAEDKEQ